MDKRWESVPEIKQILLETMDRLQNNGCSETEAAQITAGAVRRTIWRYYNDYNGFHPLAKPVIPMPDDVRDYLRRL
jgi:hypothetical protein